MSRLREMLSPPVSVRPTSSQALWTSRLRASRAISMPPAIISSWYQGQPPLSPAEVPAAQNRIVSGGYLQTMGITILRGREFSDSDLALSRPVLVIEAIFRESPIRGRVEGRGFDDPRFARVAQEAGIRPGNEPASRMDESFRQDGRRRKVVARPSRSTRPPPPSIAPPPRRRRAAVRSRAWPRGRRPGRRSRRRP